MFCVRWRGMLTLERNISHEVGLRCGLWLRRDFVATVVWRCRG